MGWPSPIKRDFWPWHISPCDRQVVDASSVVTEVQCVGLIFSALWFRKSLIHVDSRYPSLLSPFCQLWSRYRLVLMIDHLLIRKTYEGNKRKHICILGLQKCPFVQQHVFGTEKALYSTDDFCFDCYGSLIGLAPWQAYRKLSMKWHPDKNQDNQEKVCQTCKVSYQKWRGTPISHLQWWKLWLVNQPPRATCPPQK